MPAKELSAYLPPIIRRKNVVLGILPAISNRSSILPEDLTLNSEETPIINSEMEFLALIVNASQEMAKEITLQLTLAMPGCSIMYAPSIEIARWILKRKKIDLVVSSSVLPDGSVEALKLQLDSLENPPDIIVVGNGNFKTNDSKKLSNYHLVTEKLINRQTEIVQANNATLAKPIINQAVKTLGADIRNDLNNPLQEIVAMVFVAKSGKAAITTEKALEAIDNVAKNMATIVNGLEDKILKVVNSKNL